jgi:hypothetical protein
VEEVEPLCGAQATRADESVVVAELTLQMGALGWAARRALEAAAAAEPAAAPWPSAAPPPPPPTPFGLRKRVYCQGSACLGAGIGAVVVTVFIVLAIIAHRFYSVVAYRRRMRQGEVPARIVLGVRGTSWVERAALERVVFRVRRPRALAELREPACPICMNFEYGAKALDKVVLFERCQHSVCEKCFVELAARSRIEAKCPLCRTPLTETRPDPKAAAAVELPAAGGDAPESGDAEGGAAAGPGGPQDDAAPQHPIP